MADMSMIPGTPDWIKAKEGSSISKPVTEVTIKEEGKDAPIVVKSENN